MGGWLGMESVAGLQWNGWLIWTGIRTLAKCASIMSQEQSLTMVIKGYSDNAGSGTYNKKLSAFRANIVKSYLVGQGITPSRITAVGIGEKKPLKPNTTREGRRANRRVEIELAAEQAN
jgi:OOP family OmpA-OmpF porin